ncbi:MAG: hypothetical protein EBU84_14045 [Actinobacteria bacterium]|nr:hypothetical protein [Actinomycetota bacterium]
MNIDGKPLREKLETTDSVNQLQVAGPIPAFDFLQWVDCLSNLRNLNTQVYYRIRARKISTQEEVSTQPFTWDSDLDLVGLYVAEEHNFLLEDVIGVPCLVYVRRRGGITCTACFDPVQKKRTASHCTVCYGTNWTGGFYNPIDAYVDLSPNPKNSSIAEWGEISQNETQILISNYPEVSPGDIIRELRSNRLWRVVLSQPTEKRRAPMLQFVRAVEINAGDVEYKIPYDTELALKKIQELDKIRAQREF